MSDGNELKSHLFFWGGGGGGLGIVGLNCSFSQNMTIQNGFLRPIERSYFVPSRAGFLFEYWF